LDQSTILRLFARGDGTDVLTEAIKQRRSERGRRNQYSQAAIDGISDYLSGNLEQVEGIRKTVSTRLQPWHNHRIAAATSKSHFDLRDIRRKAMTIYVAISPGNMVRWRSYLQLFFEQLVNLNVDETAKEDPTVKVPALIMLDEFARLGRMQTVAEAAQFAAGYDLRFYYVVQNKDQVRAIYGDAAAIDIFDNTGVEVVFGTNDLATTKEVSERFGDNTVLANTDQKPRYFAAFNWSRQSTSTHLHRRPYVLPQDVARMARHKQFVFRAGMEQPAIITRVPWFDDPGLTSMQLPPPEIPRLAWSVAEDDGQTRVLRPKPRNIGGLSEEDK
jgi:type IV secretion system protein VirD4